jgi:hypothetical protein
MPPAPIGLLWRPGIRPTLPAARWPAREPIDRLEQGLDVIGAALEAALNR